MGFCSDVKIVVIQQDLVVHGDGLLTSRLLSVWEERRAVGGDHYTVGWESCCRHIKMVL